MNRRLFLQKGISLVEVLFAASIILIFMVALVSIHNLYLSVATSNADALKAAFLAEEGVEVVHFLRSSSWTNNIVPLALNTSYYPSWNGTTWQLGSTNTMIEGKFERLVRLSPVYRDVNGRITTSGGTLDASTKLVESRVSWLKRGATTTKSLSAYITNILDN